MKFLRALVTSLLPDPFYQTITVECGDSETARIRMLEKYFEYSILEAMRTGRCIVADPEENGAAAWLLPRNDEVDEQESRAKSLFIARLLGPRGNENYHRIIEFMSPRANLHVPENAWYLSIIGIHPLAQGRGLGQQLLRPTLEEVDQNQVVTYLETFTPRNTSSMNDWVFVPLQNMKSPQQTPAMYSCAATPVERLVISR